MAAERAVKVVVAQYKGGLVDFNRVSLVEQNLVQQQNQLAQAQGAIATGLIQVYRALGGGWQIRCGPNGTAATDTPTMPDPGPGGAKEPLSQPKANQIPKS